MTEPIVFVLETEPFNERDFIRTMDKVREVVQELIEDGVQVGEFHAVVRDAREQVLAALP